MGPSASQVECPTCKQEAAEFGGEVAKIWVEIPTGTAIGTIGKRTCEAGHTFRFRYDPGRLEVLGERLDDETES